MMITYFYREGGRVVSIYHWNGTDEVPLDVEEVIVDSGVTQISDFAFSSRLELTSISLPDSLTKIGRYAFNDCDKLTTITIPKNVSSIGDGALCFCNNLKSISVDSANSTFSSVGGVLYSKNKTKLIQYPVGKDSTDFSIRAEVEEICDYAFNDCFALKKITFGNNVVSVGRYAFTNCVNLESAIFNSGLAAVGYCAFYNCYNLKAVTLPKSLTSIGYRAFGYCDLGAKIVDFWIRGYEDTEAETYANDERFKFVVIFEPVYPTGIAWVRDRSYTQIFPGKTINMLATATGIAELNAIVSGETILLKESIDYTKNESANPMTVTFLSSDLINSLSSTDTVVVTYCYDRPETIINVGDTAKCVAYVLPSNATYRNIIYSSSNSNYLIAGDGEVTAKNVERSSGDYVVATPILTAQTAYGNYQVTSNWTVVRKVEEIQMSSLPSIKAGKLVRLTASLHPNDDSQQNVTTTRKFRWYVVDDSWKSGDPISAHLDDSVIEILEPSGSNHESTLTYTSSDKSLTATCTLIPKLPGTAKIVTAAFDTEGVQGVTQSVDVTVEKPGKTDPQIVVKGNANARTAGSEYKVDILLKNNPGIVGMNLRVKYDSSKLKLTKAEDYKIDEKSVLGNSYHSDRINTTGSNVLNPYYLCWANDVRTDNIEASDKIVTLTFTLLSDMSSNVNLPVSVFFDEENLDIYNADLAFVDFSVTNSTIKVSNIKYGDVTNNGTVNDDDLEALRHYLAKWTTPTSINEPASELSGDIPADVDHKDQVILARYLDSFKYYETSMYSSVRADSQVTLPEDAIDDSPLKAISTKITTYKVLTARPNDWATEYKGYYVKNNDEYVNVSGDTAPDASGTWPTNKYYDKVIETKNLKEGKSKDYSLSEDKHTITFHKSTYVPEDSDIDVTIVYKVYSKWKGTDYEVIPFDG